MNDYLLILIPLIIFLSIIAIAVLSNDLNLLSFSNVLMSIVILCLSFDKIILSISWLNI